MKFTEANPKPDSKWFVIVECRYNVVSVCVSGKGFYIPGQEPCWGFDHVAEWLFEITPTSIEDAYIAGKNRAAEIVIEHCTVCGGKGYTETTESAHGCDGSEEDCNRNCPIPIQSQEQCEYCGRPQSAILNNS